MEIDTKKDSGSPYYVRVGYEHRRDSLFNPIRNDDDVVKINICGTTYRPLKSTLQKFPTTLLGDQHRLQAHYVNFLDAYFFDCHRNCFEAILYYYQSNGSLVRPQNIPMETFAREVRFFGISKDVLVDLMRREGYDITDGKNELPTNKYQKYIWRLVEDPESSIAARIIAIVSILVIISSILVFCMESMPECHPNFQSKGKSHENGSLANTPTTTPLPAAGYSTLDIMRMIEVGSIAWFTLEYVIRLCSSPDKRRFVKSFLNFIDLVAILPFFVMHLFFKKEGSPLALLRVARLLRVFRVLKLSRHSMGLQVIGNTLLASVNELIMVAFVLIFNIVLFSSAIYYAEHQVRISI